jgi:hypothetical protein
VTAEELTENQDPKPGAKKPAPKPADAKAD